MGDKIKNYQQLSYLIRAKPPQNFILLEKHATQSISINIKTPSTLILFKTQVSFFSRFTLRLISDPFLHFYSTFNKGNAHQERQKRSRKGLVSKTASLMVSEQSQKAPSLPASRRQGRGSSPFFSPGGTFFFK
ncbi:hypothetical protein CDAR_172231 [Caerostris darwini]|uniref:Uncharacterized protein n=1 Tax=Caerostris darwini TaxID=1538125 RepID=A0AAV4U3E8_9ARAC|nr:hypothetical protein CDAR_172231 [Caerostris darwini]